MFKKLFTPLNKAVDPVRYDKLSNGVDEIGGNKSIAVPLHRTSPIRNRFLNGASDTDLTGFTICFIVLMLLVITAVFLSKENQAAERSPDAIAIRVMPNSDHYSPLVWYKKNIKLQGSPQNLLVDGYEAVRDGRTVYVNAANISGNNFYTNIYIISYNQDAEVSTIDIFGQILEHWKFNTNIPAEQNAAVRNDTKRLADLAEIKSALANYQNNHGGDYPSLSAGSYVAGTSISVWPSWQATLGAELGITMPLDPINKLVSCPSGYDEKTCWNQTDKIFYFNFNITAGDSKSISHSPVYWYKDGVFYAGIETSGYTIISAVSNVSFNVAAP